jgi:ABC-type multidrug transport system fused ATPase/permease subunit
MLFFLRIDVIINALDFCSFVLAAPELIGRDRLETAARQLRLRLGRIVGKPGLSPRIVTLILFTSVCSFCIFIFDLKYYRPSHITGNVGALISIFGAYLGVASSFVLFIVGFISLMFLLSRRVTITMLWIAFILFTVSRILAIMHALEASTAT